MVVFLRLQTKDNTTEIPLEIYKPITLGRSSAANYKVADELISSIHCKITLAHSKLEITDLESKNGTFINGLRIEKSDVFLGDVIKIGSTQISILQEKMDAESIQALTFLGAAKDRQSHGLQLDFTGARMVNQGQLDLLGNENKPTASANKEIEVRKTVQSKIKLSKHEIKLRNKSRASLAATLDIILVCLAMAFPLIVSNIMILIGPEFIGEYRIKLMFSSVIIFVGIYFIINFKVLKFTMGEKLSGIEKLFDDQEI